MALCQLTLTRVAVVAALAYFGYNMLTFYSIFFPPQCQSNQIQRCILPAYTKDKKLEVRHDSSITLHVGMNVRRMRSWILPFTAVGIHIHKADSWQRCKDPGLDIPKEGPSQRWGGQSVSSSIRLSSSHILNWMFREVNVSLPSSTLKNGSLYVHVFLGPKGKSPLRQSDLRDLSATSAPLTRYAIPQSTFYNLLSGTEQVVHVRIHVYACACVCVCACESMYIVVHAYMSDWSTPHTELQWRWASCDSLDSLARHSQFGGGF